MFDPTFTFKIDEETATFGRFVIEPLEQGYGQTLGNSIRRVLLTSLPGSAITAVKIDGVKHQFSTHPGLKEDVTMLILNIKKIRLHIDSDEEVTFSLSKSGPGEVTAADITVPAGVTIANPELVLGTLADKKSTLNIEFTARKGYGYVAVEEKQDMPLGVIPVDALYSPIHRVNYRVEATRVGRMTNLDKLILEVWTDGTVSARESIVQSASLLISYFQQIVTPKERVAEETVSSKPQAMSEDVLKMRIEEFDIPTRIVNALGKGGIETIGQLVNTPLDELMKVKNLGAKSLDIVEEKLKEKGITLTLTA